MTVEKIQNGTSLTLKVEGELDTLTSPEFGAILQESLEGIQELILDFEKLDYTSSAGLRVMLQAQKAMEKQGTMTILHVKDEVMEIFDITGLVDVFTIE